MDSELNISAPCNPGIDQDQTPVLEGRKAKCESVNYMYKKIYDHHTVRTPQVCSTMHDENTINTANDPVNKRSPKQKI